MIYQFLKPKRRNSCLKKSHSIAESVQETSQLALKPKFEHCGTIALATLFQITRQSNYEFARIVYPSEESNRLLC